MFVLLNIQASYLCWYTADNLFTSLYSLRLSSFRLSKLKYQSNEQSIKYFSIPAGIQVWLMLLLLLILLILLWLLLLNCSLVWLLAASISMMSNGLHVLTYAIVWLLFYLYINIRWFKILGDLTILIYRIFFWVQQHFIHIFLYIKILISYRQVFLLTIICSW